MYHTPNDYNTIAIELFVLINLKVWVCGGKTLNTFCHDLEKYSEIMRLGFQLEEDEVEEPEEEPEDEMEELEEEIEEEDLEEPDEGSEEGSEE